MLTVITPELGIIAVANETLEEAISHLRETGLTEDQIKKGIMDSITISMIALKTGELDSMLKLFNTMGIKEEQTEEEIADMIKEGILDTHHQASERWPEDMKNLDELIDTSVQLASQIMHLSKDEVEALMSPKGDSC